MDNEEEKNVVLSEESSSESNTNQESNTSVERSAANAEESASESEVSVMGNPQEIPSPNKVSSMQDRKPNKIISFFKSKVGICVLVAILIVGVLTIIFVKKFYNEKNYEKNLKEFVVESSKSAMASAYICDDLRKVWQEYIFDDKEYFIRSSGTFTQSAFEADEYCSNFSEAVNRKIRWNDENLPSKLKEPYRNAKRLYKEMTPPPGKYKEIHAYVKQIFKSMERLEELAENPTGNLTSFSADCNTAGNEFTSALSDLTNECDIDFSNKDND